MMRGNQGFQGMPLNADVRRVLLAPKAFAADQTALT